MAEVEKDSAAEKAGITTGSVITKFDGITVKSMDELKGQLAYYAAGETVNLVVKIADNGTYVEKTLTITLDAANTASSASQQGQRIPSGQEGNLWGSILR